MKRLTPLQCLERCDVLMIVYARRQQELQRTPIIHSIAPSQNDANMRSYLWLSKRMRLLWRRWQYYEQRLGEQ